MDKGKLAAIFAYHIGGVFRGDVSTLHAPFAVVFGRQDLRLAQRTAELQQQGAFDYVIPTGGVGKDSGTLTVPEAEYLAEEMKRLGVTGVIPELRASNGGENARFSLAVAKERSLLDPLRDIVAIIHSTSARRLAATLDCEARKLGWNGQIITIASGYRPDFDNPKDQQEILGELIRMDDFAQKGWLTPDPALTTDPELIELLKFARANVAA